MATQTIGRGVKTLASPTTKDDIYVLGGSAVLDTNMDYSSIAETNLIEIGNEFNGSFGTSTSPFKGRVDTSFFYNAGGGDAYWVSDGSASDVSPLLIMPRSTNGHLHFDTIGTITDAQIGGGQLTIATATVVTNLYIGNGTVRFYDDGSTDPTVVQNISGTLYLDRGATTLTHSGGQTWIQGVAANAITTLNVYGGGCHIMESGTITTLNAWGGIPCVRKLVRPLTISNTNINMSLPGAEDFLQNPLITHSSVTKYMGR